MGEKNLGNLNSKPAGDGGKNAGSTSSPAARTSEKTGGRTGRSTTRTPGGTGKPTEKGNPLPVLAPKKVSVDPVESEKTEEKEAPKKRTRTSKKSKLDTSQMEALIRGVDSVVASRPGLEHWQFTDAEVKSIATPLCGILEEKSLDAALEKYANQIALVTACVTVCAPRIMVSVQMSKAKKVNEVSEKEVKKLYERKAVGSSGKSQNKHDGNLADGGKNDVDERLAYGSPIC